MKVIRSPSMDQAWPRNSSRNRGSCLRTAGIIGATLSPDLVRCLPAGYAGTMRLPTRVAASVLAEAFELVSWARSAKSLHPHGVLHAAQLRVHGGQAGRPDLLRGVPFLTTPGVHRGVVRFSRSLGLPEPAPDVLGMAIRLPDAHGPGRAQDLLLVTSGDGPLVHHLFVPGRGYFALPYSSVLPYRGDGGQFLVGARLAADAPAPSGHGSEAADLAAAAASGRLAYEVGVAPLHGRLRPVATLAVGDRLPDSGDALRFNPWVTGGGLRPAGPLNALRDRVYRRSQRGWT